MSDCTVEIKRPLASVEGKALKTRMLAVEVDAILSFEEMAQVAGGFDYRGRSPHHHVLQKVIARLRDEQHVLFASVRGVGYRRLPDAAAVEKARGRHGRIAVQADLGLRETTSANRAALSDEERRAYDANVHIFGVHKLFSKPETLQRTMQVATNKPLPMKMDEEFLKSFG